MIDCAARAAAASLIEASIVACCAGASVVVRGGGRGSVAANVLGTACPPWIVYDHDGGRQDVHLRRRPRPAGCRALYLREGATLRPARSRAEARRSLYGRHFRRRTRLHCRRAGDPVRARAGCFTDLGPCCRGCCAICSGACSNSIRDRVRATTSRITTISTAGFTGSSSTATSNIAAPISSRRTSRSTTRNWPRSAISRRNSASSPAPRCSTSAAAGAAWRSILRKLPARG